MCFGDYEKAFDMGTHDALMALLIGIKVKQKDLRLIKSLYQKQMASLRAETEKSEEMCIEKRSPNFFNLYEISTESIRSQNWRQKLK